MGTSSMRKGLSRGRGRPRGRYFASADLRRLEYIALVSIKYDIDSEKFLNCFVKAWKHQKSKCKNLLIECRMKTRDSARFLITHNSEVVAQFSIPKRFLEDTSPIKELIRIRASKVTTQERDKMKPIRIGELKAGMKRINLEARVVEIPEPRSVYTRLGYSVKVANAIIADETGSILLPLWNEQIGRVSEGDFIRIRNASVVTFRGQNQLRINRGGQLHVVKEGEEEDNA